MAERNLKSIKDNYPVLSSQALLEYRKKLDQTLPRSGMGKGYLPEESSVQQECLPSVIDDRLHALKEQHAARNRDLVQAEWNPDKKRVFVTKCKGKCMQNAGVIINGKTVLYPEEALFLMEMSILELHFNGAIQSIQEAYRLLLGEDMALEKFQVYSHLRRLGYIVVRHKKRSDDSPKIERGKQAESMHGRSSSDNFCPREQISQASQNYPSENEYNINDRVNKKDSRSKVSTEVEPNNKKTNSHARCLWQGIDIPNMAGKSFIELEMPSLSLFPKNVCPQKQHYIIDIKASKNEVEDYYNYYEYNDSTENQTYPTESQTFNNYSDYNTYNSGENENLNPHQYKNASQDVCHFNQAAGEPNQQSMPSMSYENVQLGSFPNNAEGEQQSYNSNPHHSHGYVHNVHDMQTRTSDKQPSAEYSFNTFCNESKPSQFKNHNIPHDHSRIPSSNYGNFSSCAEHRKQEHSGYNMGNSSYNQQEQSYEANRNYEPNSNCTMSLPDNEICHRTVAESDNITSSVTFPDKNTNVNYGIPDSHYAYNSTSDQYGKSYKDNKNYGQDPSDSANLTERVHKSYNESKKDNAYIEESSKHHTYKRQYTDRQNKNFNKKYTNKNKRKKGNRDAEENLPPFPRVTKTVTCWEEFKREAELQSTAEYLMNGPAKILWNNKITPLVAPSEHMTKESVFGALSIIKSRNDTESSMSQPPAYDKLDFDVYMPTTNYSRYNPGLPSHSIKVVRFKDPTPTIGGEEKIPVHYAMVDNGTIVFYSFHNVKLPRYI